MLDLTRDINIILPHIFLISIGTCINVRPLTKHTHDIRYNIQLPLRQKTIKISFVVNNNEQFDCLDHWYV